MISNEKVHIITESSKATTAENVLIAELPKLTGNVTGLRHEVAFFILVINYFNVPL